MHDFDEADPAAIGAVRLRKRLRQLTAGQTEAFDLLYYQFQIGSASAATVGNAARRLPYLTTLLADLAWTRGDRAAHDDSPPGTAPEAAEIKRVFRPHAQSKRRTIMDHEQLTAVLAYLDALLAEVTRCIDLDEHAPSATLGREARRFVTDFTEVRLAAVS